jgi:hypothetical protein
MRRIGHIVDIHAGTKLPLLVGLLRDRHRGAGKAQAVAAKLRGGIGDLRDHTRIVRPRHVDDSDAHRRRLVCQEQHATTVGILPQRHPLTTFAGAVQVGMADDLHIAG